MTTVEHDLRRTISCIDAQVTMVVNRPFLRGGQRGVDQRGAAKDHRRAARDIELGEDPAEICCNRPLADLQPIRDDFIGVPLRDQHRDLDFAAGQALGKIAHGFTPVRGWLSRRFDHNEIQAGKFKSANFIVARKIRMPGCKLNDEMPISKLQVTDLIGVRDVRLTIARLRSVGEALFCHFLEPPHYGKYRSIGRRPSDAISRAKFTRFSI
ncbi:MAG: hypothetical protein WCC64_22175 [Aliidongia sp.]